MKMQNNNGYNEFLQKKSDMINRENAAALFHDLSTIIGCIEQSVHTRSMSLRDDRDILIDLGLQQILLNMIFNYELPWIRLGLETIFGEMISLPISQKNFNNFQFPCESGCLKWKNILKVFIQEKFFIHESLLSVSKFQSKSLKEMKGQFLLKKFLFLVLFLDKARNSNLLNLNITICDRFRRTEDDLSFNILIIYFHFGPCIVLLFGFYFLFDCMPIEFLSRQQIFIMIITVAGSSITFTTTSSNISIVVIYFHIYYSFFGL